MSAILKISRNIFVGGSMHARLQHILNNKVTNISQTIPIVPDEVVPIFRHSTQFADRIALKDNNGNYTYGNIFMSAKQVANDISKMIEYKNNERVLFLCPNDTSYVITQWAIWISGQIGKHNNKKK